MSDKDKDGLSNQETDDLLASLNQRASSGANADAASQEEEEGGEDIEAFGFGPKSPYAAAVEPAFPCRGVDTS